MPTEKTELEWVYNPADLFEVPYRRQTDAYMLVADGGVLRVTLRKPCDPIDANLQGRVTKEVEGPIPELARILPGPYSRRVCQEQRQQVSSVQPSSGLS